jgi:hypothetical protein
VWNGNGGGDVSFRTHWSRLQDSATARAHARAFGVITSRLEHDSICLSNNAIRIVCEQAGHGLQPRSDNDMPCSFDSELVLLEMRKSYLNPSSISLTTAISSVVFRSGSCRGNGADFTADGGEMCWAPGGCMFGVPLALVVTTASGSAGKMPGQDSQARTEVSHCSRTGPAGGGGKETGGKRRYSSVIPEIQGRVRSRPCGKCQAFAEDCAIQLCAIGQGIGELSPCGELKAAKRNTWSPEKVCLQS